MLLEMNDVTVCYGKAEAIRNINLQIDEGEIVGIIGNNGAGKSTTLRTIIGFNRPSNGEIWLKGDRIDKLKPWEIASKGLSLVPEGRRVFPYMTVAENLKMGGYLQHSSQISETIENMFTIFPVLERYSRRQAGNLSGGEQQMLAIARSLMSQPKLLLMDEPSLGLSPLLVQEIENVIKDLCKRGVNILLVEQNASLCFELVDRIYLLETGSIALEGQSNALREDEKVKAAYLGL